MQLEMATLDTLSDGFADIIATISLSATLTCYTPDECIDDR